MSTFSTRSKSNIAVNIDNHHHHQRPRNPRRVVSVNTTQLPRTPVCVTQTRARLSARRQSAAAMPEAVSYHGRSATRCGYCASSPPSPSSSSSQRASSVSDGAVAHALAPRTYDELINRGWRRSGSWMYKPAIGETCCAPYTIRLRCREFVRSKSQRKVVKRFERVLEEADEAGVGCQRWKAFTCTTSRSSFVEEEFELWKKYQVVVHGDSEDELRRTSYERFLVDSPLIEVSPGAGTPSVGYGAFHQQYRIDGELIAVGVIDVLPTGLSSKYFFWDPAYAHLSLGKLSALKEIEWVLNEAEKSKSPEFAYYYMGFYIHNCQKMRYKAEYSPSEILCPVTHRWVKVDDPDVRRRLDAGDTRLTNEDAIELEGCAPSDALVGLAYAGRLLQCRRLRDLPMLMKQLTFIDVSNAKLAAFAETMKEFCDRFRGSAKNVMNLVDISREFCDSDDDDDEEEENEEEEEEEEDAFYVGE